VATTLADVLRHFGPEYLRSHSLSTAQAKAWRAIVSCRTPALGGQLLRCDGCGTQQWRWHSCRNRHCPQCQARARDAWRAARLAELLDVPYCHLVFTLPHELNGLAAAHPRWVYETLMQCTAQTLSEFAANDRWLGGVGAFTLVLHTWTQDLRRHVHVHALMACGALSGEAPEAAKWIAPRRAANFLFPVHALSKVFRAKFLAALQQAQFTQALPRDPAATNAQRAQRDTALRQHDWVVYAKTPLAGPAAVLDYLARYTHRTAIGNERLLNIEDDRVQFRVRADATGGKRCIALDGQQFVQRPAAACAARGLQAHPPLRAAGASGQDPAPGARAQAACHARAQRQGARGCTGLHATRRGHRDRPLSALPGRALANAARDRR
jgi:hypothetical protein